MLPHSTRATSVSGDEVVIVDDNDHTKSSLSPETLVAIGNALQTFYCELTELPTPARLLTLLAELEAKQGDAYS